ncbi:MAG: transposase, partial [Acidobacteria bacterium]|nr:transposase [Acidobacteriota bacterium]
VIERCFVEVRRRTRPMVCFVNTQSVDRIIYAIFNRYNPQWKNRTLRHKQLDITSLFPLLAILFRSAIIS